MSRANRWLLPDGIDEVLPPQALQVEQLRRHLLDQLHLWGYDLVIPPALEYLDSLLTGTASDLDLQTFKVTDQLSGRMMGLSADTTPQVARIDAHSLAPEGVSRLCYCRTVFHAQASSLLANRTPTQLGAELFGESGACADIEIISLMLTVMRSAGLKDLHLDLGHVGVFKAFAEKAELSSEAQAELFELLAVKCPTDLDVWANEFLTGDLRDAFKQLVRLQGDAEVLEKAKQLLVLALPEAQAVIDHMQQVATAIAARFPQVPMYFDFTELRGFDYHTGLVFGAYIPGFGDAVAKGGRYDDAGAEFGRARPATGFSTDLRILVQHGEFALEQINSVQAPAGEDAELLQLIADLRQQGKRVTVTLSGELDKSGARIELVDGKWQLVN